ncbi:MAG TPA: hypothetical protein VMI31_10750, partial [Fimbriimonadaceae bacterium]|nr:hypothetical protein [Fimbriimonadaceae bacterium]
HHIHVAVTLTDRKPDGAVITTGTAAFDLGEAAKFGKESTEHARGYDGMHATGFSGKAGEIFGWREAAGGTIVRRARLDGQDPGVESRGGPIWPDESGAFAAQVGLDGQIRVLQKSPAR